MVHVFVLWQASMIISFLSFFFGLFTRSKTALLISFVTFLPIGYYFFGANNAFKLIALLAFVPLLIIYLFYRHEKRSAAS